MNGDVKLIIMDVPGTTSRNCSGQASENIGFDQDALAQLKNATISASVLSIFGSCFIIVTYHLVRTHKPLAMKLLYWLSISDLGSSFVYIVDGASPNAELMSCDRPQSFCMTKAALSQFFTLAAILWTGSIAFNLYLGLVAQSALSRQPEILLRYMHRVIWGISLGVVLLLMSAGALGRAGRRVPPCAVCAGCARAHALRTRERMPTHPSRHPRHAQPPCHRVSSCWQYRSYATSLLLLRMVCRSVVLDRGGVVMGEADILLPAAAGGARLQHGSLLADAPDGAGAPDGGAGQQRARS